MRPRGFIHGLLTLLAACGDTGDGSATGSAGTLDGPDMIVNAVTEEVFTVGSVSSTARPITSWWSGRTGR